MISTYPILSIVTVVKDDFDGILKTYLSIKDLLKSKNIEWIIIDGSGNDQIKELFYDKDSNIFYRKSFDGGIYPAMSTALVYCKGNYVWFLNARDENLIELLELEEILLTEKLPDIIKLNARVNQRGYEKNKERLGFFYLLRHTFNHQSYFLKLEKALEYPFNHKLKLAGDYNQLLNLWATNSSILYVDLDIVYYDMTGATVGSSTNNLIRLERIKSSFNVARVTKSPLVFLLCLLQIIFYSPYLIKYLLFNKTG